jgi:hypothetical protein
MLASRTHLRRLGLALLLSTVSALPHPSTAWADDEDEDEDDEEEDDGDEEEEEEDEAQPPVTAGGLYTLATYPISEIARPLTLSKGMKEVRAGIDVDMSADTAFEKWGLGFNFRYGIEDNVELQADLRTDLTSFSKLNAAVAVEASIVYDLVDFRLGMALPVTKDAATGDTGAALDFEVGFPFRYAPKPELGVVALDTFMTINTSGKPDLTPSIGVVSNPHPQFAVKLAAKLIIPDFNTEGPDGTSTFVIPISVNLQFSPRNTLDLGGEFTFPNLKPAEGNFYDQRMLLLYAQLRI